MYQALYRKWRPKTFDDVVGQEHITQTLKRQSAAGRLSHAYLFTGTRGTGKTSCAKILARAANCEHPADGNPCNECAACRGIEDGSILDVVELDAASNNRVDDVRALLDEVVYTPASVRKRVYIVDEVHMLTPQAFNALLQILEEPPRHLMFILATTEVHAVPATIKSRCQQFSFKRIRPEAITARLAYVAEREGLELSPAGAALLARMADGGMRDALSLLDRCAGERTRIGEAEILETLGLAGNLEAAGLLECVARGDAEGALSRLNRLYSGGKEMSALLGELSVLARDLMIRRAAPRNGPALMTGGFEEAVLQRLDGLVDTPRLLRMVSALQQTAAGLVHSPNRRIDTELCLVSLCDPRTDDSAAGLAARVSALEEQLARGLPLRNAPLAAAPGERDVLPPERGEPERAVPVEEPAEWEPEERTFADDPPPWTWDEPPEDPAPVPRPKREDTSPPSAEKTPPPAPETFAFASASAPAPAPTPVSAGLSWPALRARLEQVMNIADFCFVGNPDMVRGTVEGGMVTLWAEAEFVKGFIDKPDILELVAKTAEELTRSPCRALVRVGKPAPKAFGSAGGGDALDALLGLENVSEI